MFNAFRLETIAFVEHKWWKTSLAWLLRWLRLPLRRAEMTSSLKLSLKGIKAGDMFIEFRVKHQHQHFFPSLSLTQSILSLSR